MMIVSCKYDPTYVEQSERLYMRKSAEWYDRNVRKGGAPDHLNAGPEYERYVQWRQMYNACEYAARIETQLTLR